MKSNSLKQGIWAMALMIISGLIVISFSSCSKGKEETTTTDNYYVKYVINGTGAYGRFSNWTATTPEAPYTNNGYQARSWTQTYGPVKKGFKCEVKVGSGAPVIEIHVSKNTEPFALKATKTGSSVSYTINF